MIKPYSALPLTEFHHADVVAGRFPAFQATMALEHGPIYRCRLIGSPASGEFMHLVGPEANRFVLHTGREHFSHDQGWTPIIGEWLGKGLLNMDPPDHTRHRKLWSPAFTTAAIEAYLPIIQRVISERTAAWPQQKVVDVYRESQQMMFATTARALAGFTSGPQLAELSHFFYNHNTGNQSAQLLLELIAERRTRPAEEDAQDVVGMIVRARDEDGQPLSDQQIIDHINILLVAGHETTTVLSAWVLYLLATMPEQRQRLEAELATLLGDHTSPITVEALRNAKQLDNFLKEAGRLYSPVLNVPRGVLSDCTFGGYQIPAGAQIRLGLAAGHLLPHVFAEPERFDPDRFAAPRDEDRRTPYGLVTFGAGARICIGVNFAMIELKVLAAHVLRHYQLSVVEKRQPVRAGALVGHIPGGIRLRVKAR
jgi:cytochrome P450